MTTQELKQQIDKVLGNSIRCLLPSYWWKRVFGAVIDNTISKDEVKTINGEPILGEGDLRVGVKSVESVEALEKLDAVVGDIATVGASVPIQVKIADCYYSVDFEKDWDKYTAITRVEEIGLISDTEERAVNLYKFKDGRYVSTIIIGTENGYRVYKISKNDTYEDISLEEINGILAKNEYRFGIGYRWADIDSFFRFYTNSVSADAYIKGETWTRLLKEGDVTGGGGAEILELTFGETEEDRAKNVNIYNKIVEAFNSDALNIPMISVAGMLVSNVELSGIEGDIKAHMNLVSDYVVFKYLTTLNLAKTGEVTFEEELEYRDYYHIRASSDMVEFAKCVAAGLLPNVLYTDQRQGLVIADTFNGEEDNIALYFNLSKGRTKVVVSSETGEILSEEVVSSGADITIDSELSDTSENAVQNKVVTEALGILEEHLAVHSKQISSLGLSMATKEELNNKADKSDIKTINGVSLLGGGDITISGGGVSEDYVNTAIANAITNTLNTEV